MSEPFLSEIRIFGFNFAPRGWAFCDGQIISIAQNSALFSLMGTTYGGDGRTTFALPDLRGRSPRKGGSGRTALGQAGGVERVTLSENELPAHTHLFQVNAASSNSVTPENNFLGKDTEPTLYGEVSPATVLMDEGTVSSSGGGLAHNNMQPFSVLNFCIALQGVFPSRS